MGIINIIFALTIAITIVMIALFWVMDSFMYKTSKALKDIQDNQFDAEQVMKIYEMKYNRPIIMQGQEDAIKEILNRVEHEENWLFACYRNNGGKYKENEVCLAFESIRHKIKQLEEQGK